MNEELAGTINDKEKYFITGKKFTRLNDTGTYLIVNQTYYSPETEISTDAIYSDTFKYKVGVFMAEIDTINNAK